MYNKSISIILSFIIALSFLLTRSIYATPAIPLVKASSAILVDAKRGQVLFQKYSDEKISVPIASKIMTAVLAIEKSKLDAKVTISKESTNTEGSNLNLVIGEKYTVENLLTAAMLSSANDVSNALAEYIGEDIEKFIYLMNNKAKELNMKNTNFTNPSGLYDSNQFTTAQDLALLIRYALSNPVFNEIFSFKAKPWESGNKAQLLLNSNKLFWSYDGVDGGKVGYNDKNQQTAITTASRESMRLICIVLNSTEENVFEDSIRLFDYGFASFRTDVLVYKNQALKTITVADNEINLVSYNDIYYTFPIGDNYIQSIEFNIPDKLSLPVTKDKVLGTAKYVLNDNTVIDINLYPDREILPPSTLLDKINQKLAQNKDISLLLVLLLALEAILMIVGIYRLFLRIKNRV